MFYYRKVASSNQWSDGFTVQRRKIAALEIPNSGHAMNNGQNVKSQMWQFFSNYLPIADTSQ